MYRNVIVTREEHGSKNEAEKEEEKEEEEGGSESEEDRQEEGEAEGQTEKENKGNEEESEMGVGQGKEGGEENTVTNSKSDNQRQSSDSNATAKVDDGGTIKFSKVLPGSARSFPFQNLHPQTRYSLSVFGKGPGLHSKIHRLIVSTGTGHSLNSTNLYKGPFIIVQIQDFAFLELYKLFQTPKVDADTSSHHFR